MLGHSEASSNVCVLGVDFGECAVVSLSGVESVVFVRNISSHPPPLTQVRKSQRLCFAGKMLLGSMIQFLPGHRSKERNSW